MKKITFIIKPIISQQTKRKKPNQVKEMLKPFQKVLDSGFGANDNGKKPNKKKRRIK